MDRTNVLTSSIIARTRYLLVVCNIVRVTLVTRYFSFALTFSTLENKNVNNFFITTLGERYCDHYWQRLWPNPKKSPHWTLFLTIHELSKMNIYFSVAIFHFVLSYIEKLLSQFLFTFISHFSSLGQMIFFVFFYWIIFEKKRKLILWKVSSRDDYVTDQWTMWLTDCKSWRIM